MSLYELSIFYLDHMYICYLYLYIFDYEGLRMGWGGRGLERRERRDIFHEEIIW